MIEKRFKDAIDRYVEHRIAPGDFLCAILRNDLKETIGRASEESMLQIREIVRYCYNEIPSIAWGSEESFKRWVERKLCCTVIEDAYKQVYEFKLPGSGLTT